MNVMPIYWRRNSCPRRFVSSFTLRRTWCCVWVPVVPVIADYSEYVIRYGVPALTGTTHTSKRAPRCFRPPTMFVDRAWLLLAFLLRIFPNQVICFSLSLQRRRSHTLLATSSTSSNTASDHNSGGRDARCFEFSCESSEFQTTRRVKEEILDISRRTDRGFSSSSSDQKRARELIFELAKFNPTLEPASPFYPVASTGETNVALSEGGPTLAGKWTLAYTDAPDITSLGISQKQEGSLALPPAAKLGRIGQSCAPPLIQNVIEWQQPDWASNLPFLSGSTRVLQKVLTEAVASPNKPKLVQLKVVGFDLVIDGDTKANRTDFLGSISPLMAQPIQARFPFPLPFGEFEVLFLDNEMRAVRTGENFLAVNIRESAEWF